MQWLLFFTLFFLPNCRPSVAFLSTMYFSAAHSRPGSVYHGWISQSCIYYTLDFLWQYSESETFNIFIMVLCKQWQLQKQALAQKEPALSLNHYVKQNGRCSSRWCSNYIYTCLLQTQGVSKPEWKVSLVNCLNTFSWGSFRKLHCSTSLKN